MALNVVPCNDVIVNEDDTQITSVVQDDGHSGQDSELCSPFCQCHCCHVHTIDFDIIAFKPLQPSVQLEYFSHFDSNGKDISLSLLQPPQA